MKKLLLLLALAITGLVYAATGNAWHAADAQPTAACLNGTYNITATITQSGQWPGAFVKSVTPSTLPGNTTGTTSVSIKIGWPNSNDTQTFPRSVTTDGKCQVVCEPVTIIKEVPVEKIVYVDKIIEKRVEVPVEKIVYVDRVVEKVIEKPVYITKTVTKTVVKYKTKIVVKTKIKVIHDRPKCPKPKPKPPGCEGDCDKVYEGAKG